MNPYENYTRISSHYGWRIDPKEGTRAWHTGIDLVKQRGYPIPAFLGGTVIRVAQDMALVGSGYGPGYGLVVSVKHADGLTGVYAHLDKANVKVGQTIKQGDIIGLLGNTGRSTGPHLHFEVRTGGYQTDVDPTEYLVREYAKMPQLSWQDQIMMEAMQRGLITQEHDPMEKADKWFVLQVIMNSMK